LPVNDKVKAISCSIPVDANRGLFKRISHSKTPYICYETALIGHDDDVVYIEDLGYEDIRRFDSPTEMAEEVERVVNEVVDNDNKV
jgi:hypothetical protein